MGCHRVWFCGSLGPDRAQRRGPEAQVRRPARGNPASRGMRRLGPYLHGPVREGGVRGSGVQLWGKWSVPTIWTLHGRWMGSSCVASGGGSGDSRVGECDYGASLLRPSQAQDSKDLSGRRNGGSGHL